MKFGMRLMAGALVCLVGVTPVAADPGDHRRDEHRRHHDDRHDRDDRRAHGRDHGCPPGLAKKGRDCMPPGHARKRDEERRHYRTGDRFRPGDFALIRDPRRYHLEPRRDWSYFRDGNRAYRVDNDTQRIIAVLNLIDAFTN